ncbi:Tetratricopeptide-like helical domain, partial [Trinorchestia longiramus]
MRCLVEFEQKLNTFDKEFGLTATVKSVKDGEVKKRRKVSRAQKLRDAKQLEEQLREAERSRLTKDTIGPQTEDDYRELLLTNKACSATWIQYISFLLAAGEHERARATARRGLSIIPFEEQKERINLWIVLLRLEVMYGMHDSAAETALAEACSNADDYTILTNMADIYQENEMLD